MKTLVTHIRPHLDDICGMWLFVRFVPEAGGADLDFIPTNERGGDVVDSAQRVHIGVGRGKYDEHKGDIGQCATTLVWNDIKPRIKVDDLTLRALENMVNWVWLEDMGKLNAEPHRFYSVPAMIEGYFDSHQRDSEATTRFGFEMLDALLVAQRGEVRIEEDWKNRVEFESRYGKTVAVIGRARQVDAYGYAQGFPVVVIMSPEGTYHTIRADARSNVDLTPTYEKLKAADPAASWYFHHSKKMIICGGDHAPQAVTSKLKMEDLIAAMK